MSQFLPLLPSSVRVDTVEFEFSHGKKPRGYGSWAFAENRREDSCSPKIFWVNQATYTEAKKKARQHFAAQGVDYIYALS